MQKIHLILKAKYIEPLLKTRVKIRNLYDKVYGKGAYDKISVSKKAKESKEKIDINVSPDEPAEMMSAEAHERYQKAKKKLAAYTGTTTHYGRAIAARAEEKMKEKKVEKACAAAYGDMKPKKKKKKKMVEKAESIGDLYDKLDDPNLPAVEKKRVKQELKKRLKNKRNGQ